MTSKPNWRGLYPALTTKMTERGAIDWRAHQIYVDRLIEKKVDGLVLCGSLGEASSLTLKEKCDLVKATVEMAKGRVPVVASVAENSTKAALEFVEEARQHKADALMVLPPLGYKAREREIEAHFDAVTGGSDLPVMVYNNPVDYQNSVSLELFEKLAQNPKIEAIKDSTRDPHFPVWLEARLPGRFSVLAGVDTLAYNSKLLGATGWVTGLGLAYPEEAKLMWKKAGSRDPVSEAEAHTLNIWFQELLKLDISPLLVQNIKWVEHVLYGDPAHSRPPRLPLSDATLAEIKTLVETKGRRYE